MHAKTKHFPLHGIDDRDRIISDGNIADTSGETHYIGLFGRGEFYTDCRRSANRRTTMSASKSTYLVTLSFSLFRTSTPRYFTQRQKSKEYISRKVEVN